MGIARDPQSVEIDLVKEMAEALGSTGLKLEDILAKASGAREEALDLLDRYHNRGSQADRPDPAAVNESIRAHNALVDQAEDTLRWLLIQREACGFRTHRNVHVHYPIPAKIKLVKE
jgi:hypothetical protein